MEAGEHWGLQTGGHIDQRPQLLEGKIEIRQGGHQGGVEKLKTGMQPDQVTGRVSTAAQHFSIQADAQQETERAVGSRMEGVAKSPQASRD